MRKIIILTVLTLGIFLAGCEKDDDKIIKEDYKFEAIVIGPGIDCGTYISLKNLETDSEFEDGIYIAHNLDPELVVPELKIYLNCRQINSGDGVACSTLGPGYPHLVVINSVKAEE